MTKEAASVHQPSAKERLPEELRRYLAVSAYLYVCFAAILFYKSAILSGIGEHYLPFGLAAGKALIQAAAALAERSWPETLASCFLMLLVLIPLATVTEVSRTLGPEALHRLLLGSSRS